MYQNAKIVCIIPARGGSKRLAGKNIRPLHGKPLIAYGIEAAKGSRFVDRVIASTDDEAIAQAARVAGAEIPFMRPAELASDTATSLATLQHAVSAVESAGEHYDFILLIQPTVPGVLATDVDAAIEALFATGAATCISVCEIADRPEWMYARAADGVLAPYSREADAIKNTRSQDLPVLYRINGAIYLTPRDVLMGRDGEPGKIIDNASCASVVMPRERSTDIDTLADFTTAEVLMQSAV